MICVNNFLLVTIHMYLWTYFLFVFVLSPSLRDLSLSIRLFYLPIEPTASTKTPTGNHWRSTEAPSSGHSNPAMLQTSRVYEKGSRENRECHQTSGLYWVCSLWL